MRFGKIHFGNQYLKAIGHGFQKPMMLCEGPKWKYESVHDGPAHQGEGAIALGLETNWAQLLNAPLHALDVHSVT